MERYKLGSLSGIDLREVQKSLLDARESLLSVEFQAKLAEISLLAYLRKNNGVLLVNPLIEILYICSSFISMQKKTELITNRMEVFFI